jgi:hypothetical protein
MSSDYADDLAGLLTAFNSELVNSSTTYITFYSRNSLGFEN